MNETVAVGKLRAYIERVERIEADIADLNGDKSEVYKELRGDGFDVKTVRKIVAKRKLSDDVRDEADALFDLYWNALTTGAPRVHVHEETNSRETASGGYSADPEAPEDSVSRTGRRNLEVPRNGPATAGETRGNQGQPIPHSPASSSRQADTAGADAPPSAPAPIHDAEVPAFLKTKKTVADYRPHCQKPDACGASGLQHCYSCKKAMEADEVAA